MDLQCAASWYFTITFITISCSLFRAFILAGSTSFQAFRNGFGDLKLWAVVCLLLKGLCSFLRLLLALRQARFGFCSSSSPIFPTVWVLLFDAKMDGILIFRKFKGIHFNCFIISLLLQCIQHHFLLVLGNIY